MTGTNVDWYGSSKQASKVSTVINLLYRTWIKLFYLDFSLGSQTPIYDFFCAHGRKCVINVPLLFSARSFFCISLLYETKDF